MTAAKRLTAILQDRYPDVHAEAHGMSMSSTWLEYVDYLAELKTKTGPEAAAIIEELTDADIRYLMGTPALGKGRWDNPRHGPLPFGVGPDAVQMTNDMVNTFARDKGLSRIEALHFIAEVTLDMVLEAKLRGQHPK